jgi:cytochrome c biogenesis protein CcmG/thiol:disulfide interchange protein DsbE
MKQKPSTWINIALYALVGWMILQRAPAWFRQTRAEGQPLPAITVPLLDGGLYASAEDSEPRAIVFWATWCGPCTMELRRIQRMIDDKKIPASSVIAISSYEDAADLRRAAQDREYTFRIGIDHDGRAQETVGVEVTPTVMIKSRDQKVVWVTSGLSPTLEWRLRKHLGL